MKALKILITGGAGFQGSHLAEMLIQRGHTVSLLNTPSEESMRNLRFISKTVGFHPDVIWGSVTDDEIVSKAVREKDLVLHLAARINVDESLKNARAFVAVNIFGTYNILEAACQAGAEVIYASSCEIYGQSAKPSVENIEMNPQQIAEKIQFDPHSPYAATKLAADRLCYAYFKSFGLPVVIVRPFNLFGERQKEEGFGAVIPIFVKRGMEGKPLLVHGDGSQQRDYTYISDLMEAYRLVIENKNRLWGEAINFASGRKTAIRDIAQYISEHFKVPIEYTRERPGQVEEFTADISKAEKLGFKAKVGIQEGLKQYIRWRTRGLS